MYVHVEKNGVRREGRVEGKKEGKGGEEEQNNITDNTYRTLYTSTFPIPTHTAKQIPPTGLRGGRERDRETERQRETRRETERDRERETHTERKL